MANLDAGLVGAAVLAGRGLGAFATLDDAVSRMVRPERTFEPDPAQKPRHDEGFARYLDLLGRLKGFGA